MASSGLRNGLPLTDARRYVRFESGKKCSDAGFHDANKLRRFSPQYHVAGGRGFS